ncbi:RNA-splicing factor [Physocladia obscura]|uniref:RNA-splicing factor n=1 Tax=Physocladia obscura TaxID=109957 RepID=A0AAD5T037_9FUNG|nr:RNA-splicing factor [Physocladia obscura]
MYATPGEAQAMEEDREAYLLGKKRIDKLVEQGSTVEEMSAQATFSANDALLYGANANSERDIANKIREDPLLAIKRREQASLQAVINNPVRLKALKAEREAKEKNKEKKKDTKTSKKSSSKSDKHRHGSNSDDNNAVHNNGSRKRARTPNSNSDSEDDFDTKNSNSELLKESKSEFRERNAQSITNSDLRGGKNIRYSDSHENNRRRFNNVSPRRDNHHQRSRSPYRDTIYQSGNRSPQYYEYRRDSRSPRRYSDQYSSYHNESSRNYSKYSSYASGRNYDDRYGKKYSSKTENDGRQSSNPRADDSSQHSNDNSKPKVPDVESKSNALDESRKKRLEAMIQNAKESDAERRVRIEAARKKEIEEGKRETELQLKRLKDGDGNFDGDILDLGGKISAAEMIRRNRYTSQRGDASFI